MVIERGLWIEALKKTSGIYGTKWNARFQTCVKQAQALSVQQNKFCTPGIARLGFSSCPDTVLFRVPKFIVDTLKLMLWGRFHPHVVQKIDEVSPSFVNGNTSSSVMLKCFGRWVARSRNHALPSNIFTASPHSSTMAMVSGFSFQASARSCAVFSRERKGGDGYPVPTGTLTVPVDTFTVIKRLANYGQTIKCFPGHINLSFSFPFFAETSARSYVATLNVLGMNECGIPATALANPSSFSSTRIFSTMQYRKTAELFSGEITKLHNLMVTQCRKECNYAHN